MHNTQSDSNSLNHRRIYPALLAFLLIICTSLFLSPVQAETADSDCASVIKKATLLFAKGDIVDACKVLEQSKNKCQNSFKFQILYSTILSRRRGFKKQAEEAAARACKLDPKSAAAHLQLGMCRLALKDKEGAANAFAQLVQNDPTSYEGWSSLGMLYTDLKMPDEAKACAQKAACLEPQSRDAKLKVASNLVQIGRFDEAKKELNNLIMDDSLEPEFQILVTKEALRLGAYEQVLKAANKVLETYPDSFDTLKSLAQAQLWLRQYSKCLETLAKLKTSSRDSTLISGAESFCHLNLGNMKLARQARDLALKNNSNEPIAQLANGIILFREGRVKDGISALRETFAKDQRFSPAHMTLCRVYLKMGDTEAALEEVNEVRRRSEHETDALALEGRIFLSSGFGTKDMKRGRDKLLKALNRDGKNPDGLIGRSVINLRAGNISEAESLVRQVIKIQPGNVDALILMSKVMALKGEQNQSREFMKKARELAPGEGDVLIAEAQRLIDRGKANKAIASLKSSISTYKEFPKLEFVLAKILNERGDHRAAAKYFKESLDKGLKGVNAKEARRAIKELVTQ